MKSFSRIAMLMAMMGGISGMGAPDPFARRYSFTTDPEPATPEQRRMFTQPVKLNKKQKAKRKSQSK